MAVIRNTKSDLVLDASEYVVKLQKFTGFPAQRWTMESNGSGKFFIVNKGNGKVLDIAGGVVSGANLVTYTKHGGNNQQWVPNLDNTIVNTLGKLVVDVRGGNCKVGDTIIAYPKHGGPNQQFCMEHQ